MQRKSLDFLILVELFLICDLKANYVVDDHRYQQHHYYVFTVPVFTISLHFRFYFENCEKPNMNARVISRSAGLKHRQATMPKVDKLLTHANTSGMHTARAHAKFYDENLFVTNLYSLHWHLGGSEMK